MIRAAQRHYRDLESRVGQWVLLRQFDEDGENVQSQIPAEQPI